MEAINIPQDNVPAELKLPIEQTLKRANELKKVDPVIAYWCMFLLLAQWVADSRHVLGGAEGAQSSQPEPGGNGLLDECT